MRDLIALDLEKYCDLFVSLLYYEDDFILQYYHYLFTGNVQFFDFDFWSNLFYQDLLDRYDFDSKRFSYYIAEGNEHMMFLDANWTDIGVECEEAPTAKEYVIDVVGDRSLVQKYYGNSQKRVRDFPKYSWVNLDIECLECDEVMLANNTDA